MGPYSAWVYNTWTVLLICGVSQGVFLFILLFAHKRGLKRANRLLAFLILAVSLLLTEHLLFRFRLAVVDDHRHFISFATPISYLIGPLYFLYAKALFEERFQLGVKSSLHFLPAILCLLNYIPAYSLFLGYDLSSDQPILNSRYFFVWLSGYVHMGFFIFQTGIYTYRTYRALPVRGEILQGNGSDFQAIFTGWFKKMTILMLALMGVHVVALVYFVLLKYVRGGELVLVFGLTFIVYSIGYITLKQPEIFSSRFFRRSAAKYLRSPLSSNDAKKHAAKIVEFVTDEKPYLRRDLKLQGLAASLSIPANHLSQTLNQEFGLNFSDFINQYRVKEVQEKLLDPAYDHLTQLAIAYECGFNSKASFNRAFKKMTRMTPSQFVKSRKK